METPIKILKETDLAWAAGFFDGEGCILIRRGKHKDPKRKIQHSLVLSVVQTDVRPLNTLQRLFGGSIHVYTRTIPNRKQIWTWRINKTSVAANILKLLYPYLQVKMEEAEIALGFPFTEKPQRITNEVFDLREFIYHKLRAEKKVIHGVEWN